MCQRSDRPLDAAMGRMEKLSEVRHPERRPIRSMGRLALARVVNHGTANAFMSIS
jgi:hypothetical protein